MTDYTKIDAYPRINLIKGSGETYEQGFCVMQAVSWFAGEAHTYNPECACPVLGAYAIRLNDTLPDDKRQELRKLIAPFTGTRSKEHEQARAEYIVRRTAHDIVAVLFEKRWPQHAKAICAAQTMLEIKQACRKAKAYAAADAAAADAAAATIVAAAAADTAAYAAAYAAYAADAAAYAAAYAADAAYARFQDIGIDILAGAIRLGPNGGDDLTPFAERIHEMCERGYAEAVA